MIRGTCQEFQFKLPYPYNRLNNVEITFWQKEHKGSVDCPLPIVKKLKDCKQNARTTKVSVELSQIETLAFSEFEKGFVQFRGITEPEGKAFAGQITPFPVYPIYSVDKNDEVLDYIENTGEVEV